MIERILKDLTERVLGKREMSLGWVVDQRWARATLYTIYLIYVETDGWLFLDHHTLVRSYCGELSGTVDPTASH